MNHYKKILLAVSLILFMVLSTGWQPLYSASVWEVGFVNMEGQFGVELDDGTVIQASGDVGLSSRYWINDNSALRFLGSFNTADGPLATTNTFHLGAYYLSYFGPRQLRFYAGGGLYFADDIDGNDDYIAVDGVAGIHWIPDDFPLSFALGVDAVSLVVEPASNFYIAKQLMVEVLYSF